MRIAVATLLVCLSIPAATAVIDDEIEIQGHLIELGMAPDEGGALHTFGLRATPGNLAGGDGLLQEGFGVGNFYVPNRRLNEKMEALDSVPDRPVLQYTYECDGPNIRGLEVLRKTELLPDEASVRVTWSVKNGGDERQWVAPWVRNEATPGGTAEARDRFDIPTRDGIVQPEVADYRPATRNWAAMTDPIEKETLYLVFDAGDTHSFLAEPYDADGSGEAPAHIGLQTAFVPFLLAPGETWTTTYRLNSVRGLTHVDFATDEFAMQVDYDNGTLTLLFSAVKSMPDLQLDLRIKAADGEVWTLPRKQFSLAPDRLARCTYDWTAPAGGAYEILARVEHDGDVVALGADTGSPHGGIDTRFTTGRGPAPPFEAWTGAPHALDQGPRALDRPLIAENPARIWAESPLQKILPQDQARTGGPIDPTVRIALARGEAESFQLALRPSGDEDLDRVNVNVRDLTNPATGTAIPASRVDVYTQHYQRVTIPSHFEGPTGEWPDALLPLEPFEAPAGRTTPLWFTVSTDEDDAPGAYRGMIEIQGDGLPPVELFLEVDVFDFKMPSRPLLKTDFVYDPEQALAAHERAGGRLDGAELDARFLEHAAEHRVTLRGALPFPAEQADLESALNAYKGRLDAAGPLGTTTLSVPATLLNYPEQLAVANDFVRDNGWQNRAFVHLANEPPRPAWPRLMAGMQAWNEAAPDIPIMITTYGLDPFIPDSLDLPAVHAPVFDTANNTEILDRIGSGGEVWWYVDQTPPRPYGNFFVDFEAIEHRILFWQAWALGIRGMHYHGINDTRPGQDPWESLLDLTPVNGDGFLVYTGADGPINSIRWENIRDGIEDYDYLAIFNDRRRRLLAEPGHEALLKRAADVYNLQEVIPSLVEFTRDPAVLEKKRREIAEMIVEMNAALR